MTTLISCGNLFVSIACYRDPELIPTLRDMIAMAACPQNLHITVCWQHDLQDRSMFTQAGMTLVDLKQNQDETVWKFVWQQAQITVIPVHYFHSQGACWARSMAEKYYAGEAYTLQIDSHCRFTPQWDQSMVNMLEGLRLQSSKPVLSTYPPPYAPDEPAEKRGQFASRLIFREFSKEGLPMLSSMPVNADAPVRGSYLAGGFIFADGSFILEVANDPNIFFAGEEIAMAARAFTHGYDVYTPHKILLWHYYGRKQANKVWGDHTGEAKNTGEITLAWWERDRLSKKRIRTLFDLEDTPENLGAFGLGKVRSLYQFERLTGIDFKSRAVLPAVLGSEKESAFTPEKCPDDIEWSRLLTSPFKKTLTLKKSEIIPVLSERCWLYLGVYNTKNRLINQKKYMHDEIAGSLTAMEDGQYNLSLDFCLTSQETPFVIRICPYDENDGWGTVVEKIW